MTKNIASDCRIDCEDYHERIIYCLNAECSQNTRNELFYFLYKIIVDDELKNWICSYFKNGTKSMKSGLLEQRAEKKKELFKKSVTTLFENNTGSHHSNDNVLINSSNKPNDEIVQKNCYENFCDNGGNSVPTVSAIDNPETPNEKKKPIRVYVDGVFDLIHSGHFNALRQAKNLGDILVVGVNSDEEVHNVKGIKPIYSELERVEIIRECKWVNEVVIGTPYTVSMDLLNSLNCDFVAHGDDFVCNSDGADCYTEPREAGKLRIFKRTEGVCTSNLISRLLNASKNCSHESTDSPNTIQKNVEDCTILGDGNNDEFKKYLLKKKPKIPLITPAEVTLNNLDASIGHGHRSFLSTKRFMQFIEKAPTITSNRAKKKIVYVDGSFDILNVGHIRTLKEAKKLGDYLIVGIYDDSTIQFLNGAGFPVTNLLGRTLDVLALRIVDEVIMETPWAITEYLIRSFSIDTVVRGCDSECMSLGGDITDPYEIPKKMGIYREIENVSINTKEIIRRITRNEVEISASIRIRNEKEERHWNAKEKRKSAIIPEIL